MNASAESAVEFACQGERLVGIVHEPQAQHASVGVLFVVGGPQYRVGSHRQFVLMARRMADAGFPVMRFDYRGMGDSGGAPRSFEDVESDISTACGEFLASASSVRHIILLGLCDAASALLMHCNACPRVCGLIVLNPWVRSQAGEARAYIRHYYSRRIFQRSFWQKLLSGSLEVSQSIGSLAEFWRARKPDVGTAASAKSTFVERMQSGVRAFKGPILVLLSGNDLTADEFVDLRNRDPSWRQALDRPDIRTIRLEGADHTFSRRHVLENAVTLCLGWLQEVQGNLGANVAPS